MKFSCEKELILKEINIAQEIISSRNILSVLSNVLLETSGNTLKIKASDVKVSYESNIEVDVAVQGSATIYCEKFLSILKSLPEGDIEFELQDNVIFSIKPVFKKIDFQIKSISSENFPEIPDIDNESYFELPQSDFTEMISNTIFAISDDETRYFMNGVYIENAENKLVMVASDGRRLSYAGKNIENIPEFQGIIIPPKILNIVRKLVSGEGNLSIAITEKNIFIKLGNHKFISNLIDGRFPNYNKVIPAQQEHRLIVEKKLFESAIKRVSLLAEQKSRRVYLVLNNSSLVINSDKSEIGMAQEEIPCEYDGPDGTIVLNYIYVLEPLKEMDVEKIAIEFTETDKTVKIKSEPEKDYIHVIMPMQKK